MDVTNKNSIAVEAFNTICTNLNFLSVDNELKKIVITSSIKGEGKTTVSTNMAYSLASMKNRVLLVDGDMRNPTVHRMFSLPNRYGLSEIILSRQGLQGNPNALVQYNECFHIITAGHRPPNPTELLGSHSLGQFLDEVASFYDYVLVDSPPVLLVPDALALTHQTDGLVLVTRHGYTTKDMLKSTKEALSVVNAKPLACVFNGIPEAHKSYTKYGYGYYGDDEKGKAES